jgi:hypothetical protein
MAFQFERDLASHRARLSDISGGPREFHNFPEQFLKFARKYSDDDKRELD